MQLESSKCTRARRRRVLSRGWNLSVDQSSLRERLKDGAGEGRELTAVDHGSWDPDREKAGLGSNSAPGLYKCTGIKK